MGADGDQAGNDVMSFKRGMGDASLTTPVFVGRIQVLLQLGSRAKLLAQLVHFISLHSRWDSLMSSGALSRRNC